MSVKMTAQVDITFDGAFDNCHIYEIAKRLK